MNFRGIGAIVLCLIATGTIGSYVAFSQSNPQSITVDEALSPQFWGGNIDASGAREAYDFMARAITVFSPYERHFAAHAFGAALYVRFGLDAINYCEPRPNYACYHQVILDALREYGFEVIPALRSKCESAIPEQTSACKHGIGHGIMAETEFSIDGLNSALKLCDDVSSVEKYANCHSGVFMEFDRPMSEEGKPDALRPVPDGNYFSPCTEVASSHYLQCIHRRAVWWLSLFNHEPVQERFLHAMELCRSLRTQDSEAYRICVAGIGIEVPFVLDVQDSAVQTFCADISENDTESSICLDSARKSYPFYVTD